MFIIFFFLFTSKTIELGLPIITPLVVTNDMTIEQTDGSTFDLSPHTNFGNCSCDVSSSCDPYCCCDPDCSGISFPYCIDESTTSHQLRMCSDQKNESGGKVIDWFLRTSLCIQRDNNPSRGDFYDLDFNIGASTDIDTEINPSSMKGIFENDQNSNRDGLRPFMPIKDAQIPRRSKNGQCEYRNILYLESVDEYCAGSNVSLRNCSASLSACNNNETCIASMVADCSEDVNSSYHTVIKWGIRPQGMSPTGYHSGEIIKDSNGDDILLGDLCVGPNWQNFSIYFGKQTDILCEIEYDGLYQEVEINNKNVTQLNFSDTSVVFKYKNYSISPFVNRIDGNIGYIRQQIPDVVIIDSNITITQSLSIIYKSIGPKENPQHIISDFKVNYFTARSQSNAQLLRIVVRFYEQPNELNIFDNPSMSDIYQWLPF